MTHDLSLLRRRLLTVAATALAVTLPAALLAPSALAKPGLPHHDGLAQRLVARGHRHRRPHGVPRLPRGRRHLPPRPADGRGFGDQPGPGHAVGRPEGRGRPAVGAPAAPAEAVESSTWPPAPSRPRSRSPPAPSFVNDVLLTDDAAWFTDSAQAQLYRVSLADWSVTTLPLSGEWVQNPGNNANGISRHARRLGARRHQLVQRHPVPRRPGQRRGDGRGRGRPADGR